MISDRARTWLKRGGIVVAVLLLLGLLALETVRFIGTRAGVVEVALPHGSEIEALSRDSDYFDAYRVTVAEGPVSLTEVMEHLIGAPGPGVEGVDAGRADNEVVVPGRAPGLRFFVSYHVESRRGSTDLTMSTVVVYDSWLGAVYFTPVKQVHRRLLPFLFSRLARRIAPIRPFNE